MPGKLVSLVEQLKMLAQSRAEPDAGRRERGIRVIATGFLDESARRSPAP
jgi:hypothetical protein